MATLTANAPARKAPTQADRKESMNLVAKAQAGDLEARNALIERHLPLLHRLAAKCATRTTLHDDLVSEGTLALVQAIQAYEVESSVPFEAYAATWIKHAMCGAIRRTHNPIRFPGRELTKMNRVTAMARKIWMQEGRHAQPGEIAAALKLKESEVMQILERSSATIQTTRGAEHTDVLSTLPDRGAGPTASLDSPTADQAQTLVESLDDVERELVVRRFGLCSRQPATIRELARDFSLAPRQVETTIARALNRLRSRVAAA